MICRIVGFDPGLQRTGYGVVAANGGRLQLIEAGVLRISAGDSLERRLKELFDAASEVIRDHRPTAVAVEELFSHYERPRTAVLMGHARGVLLLAAAGGDVPVYSYLPTRVKKATTGSGRASKEQMLRAVQTEFGLAEPPDPPDVADALAVAICHFHRTRFQKDAI